MSDTLLPPDTYSLLSVEERETLSVEERRELDLFERELKREVIQAGDVGPISKAAQEWLNHFTTPARGSDQSVATKDLVPPKKDLVTPEQRKARLAYLVGLREAAKKAEAERTAARKARRMGTVVHNA
ncbi:hypothetical protein MSAN_01365400 [Mycena sanguinolenta]|uniref:Uncharacterized protein n=1 Tax=Mycena sanguinolenta TaxID=230812 RepID=A0A8H6YAI0_9AGAR|nr:hypothetical protein MSAN_01365400 [Mycena sanguinolenta]